MPCPLQPTGVNWAVSIFFPGSGLIAVAEALPRMVAVPSIPQTLPARWITALAINPAINRPLMEGSLPAVVVCHGVLAGSGTSLGESRPR